MTLFDMLFFIAILLGVLLGIAGGVHLAYSIADKESDENESLRVPASTPSKRSKHKDTKVKDDDDEDDDDGHGRGEKEEGRLYRMLHGRQKQQSYSEFDCQFTDENHDDKLKKAMGEQDAAYNILGREVSTV